MRIKRAWRGGDGGGGGTGRKRGLPETDIALVVGRAAWWWQPVATAAQLPPNAKPEKLSFTEALKDFLRNVSFHCYGKLVELDRRFEERFLWLVLHIAALCILIIFLWNNYRNEGASLATTIYNPLYPVQKVAFPNVAICSINRMSNASAMRYAAALNDKDPSQRGVPYFYEHVHMFSQLYHQFDDFPFESLLEFQSFLDIYDTEDFEMYYNTRKQMRALTPGCEQMLVQCRLGGKDIDCGAAFQQVLTGVGYCCQFNSDGRYGAERSFDMRFFGKERGLQVLLNSSVNDYFYRRHRTDGFTVMFYAQNSLPYSPSGSVNEWVIQTGFDSSLAITPTVLEALQEIRYLGPKARNCLFADEMWTIFPDGYSHNKCITRCRSHSILVLCQCMPFFMLYEQLGLNGQPLFCTLKHLQCLRRYKFKWLNVITQRQYVHGLEREMEDSLYCPECLPSCTETTYTARLMGQPLNVYNLRSYPKKFRDDVINNNDPNTDLALLSVFFAEPHAQYFQQILRYSWFEMFSSIGSICGLLTGFSLIGIAEVFFFFGQQVYVAFKNEILAERRPRQVKLTEQLIILP